jgi:hypothetical protein
MGALRSVVVCNLGGERDAFQALSNERSDVLARFMRLKVVSHKDTKRAALIREAAYSSTFRLAGGFAASATIFVSLCETNRSAFRG